MKNVIKVLSLVSAVGCLAWLLVTDNDSSTALPICSRALSDSCGSPDILMIELSRYASRSAVTEEFLGTTLQLFHFAFENREAARRADAVLCLERTNEIACAKTI